MELFKTRDKSEKYLSWSAGAAALALAVWQFGFRPFKTVQALSHYADRGELLFHAIHSKAVSFAMPLPGMVLAWFKYHLGADPFLPFRAAGFMACLAAYAIGARGGRSGRGAFFALAAALAALGPASNEAEQVFYVFALMVFLLLELARQERGGFALAAVSGLAAGFSMLVRSPLFLFPPLAAAWGLLSARGTAAGRGGRGRQAAAALLFIVCAYIPVAPWARLNYHLFDRVILFEEARPSSNIITGAKGLVFTIEGDARAFAGLSRDESVYPWAVRTVLADPIAYAAAVLKRIWAVFLMFPLLFGLAAAGLFFCRSPGNRFTAFLAVYFVAVHCLLAVEERYFYPLKYLLAMIAAAGAWELAAGRKEAQPAPSAAGPLRAVLFLALALPSAAVLIKVWEYPRSAGYGLPELSAESARYPSDPWLLRKEGEAYLSFDLTAAGLDRLGRACGHDFPDLCYLSYALGTERPAYPPESLPEWYELTLVKMFRELESGLYDRAAETLARAKAHWGTERNAVRSEDDAAHLAAIKGTNRTFWDSDIPSALLYWPPKERPRLLARLERLEELTPRLKCLAVYASGGPGAEACRKSFPEDAAGSEFDWSGNLRALSLALLELTPSPPADAGGAAGLLLGLRLSPEGTLDNFDTPRKNDVGAELRAAAAAWHFGLSTEYGREAAARLHGLDPDNFAYALIRLGAVNYGEAEMAEFARALSKRPYPLAAGASVYAARGDKEKALELARAAARGPLREEGWNKLFLVFQAAGEYGEGISTAGRALKEYPKSPLLLNARGVLRSLSGDEAGARKDLSAALEADPGNFQAVMSLGALLERAGRKEEAKDLYGTLLERGELGPGQVPLVREALDRSGG